MSYQKFLISLIFLIVICETRCLSSIESYKLKVRSIKPTSSLAIFGTIFTSDRSRLWAEALLIENDRIAFVGSKEDCKKLINDQTIIKTLGADELVLPGFIDSHTHPIQGGLMETECKITGVPSLDLAAPIIKDFIERNPHLQWINAGTYGLDWFFGSKPLTYRDLDEICPDKPLVILRSDAHAFFVNSKALQAAGIDETTPNPSAGVIEKDSEGKLTGVLLENAMNLIRVVTPPVSDETQEAALNLAIDMFTKEGITAFMEAYARAPTFKTYAKYAEQAKPGRPRIALSIGWDQFTAEEKSTFDKKTFADKLKIVPSEKLKVSTVKLFIDGVLESKTAYFVDPYLSDKGEEYYGLPNFSEEELGKVCELLHANDVQIHSHCIGDKSSRIVLDSIEKARKKFGEKDIRHYIAHAEYVKKEDLTRFKELGVGSNLSPYWGQYNGFAVQLLGIDRAQFQYPIKSLLESGANVNFGSDWPVTTFRPLDAIEVAVTRRALGGKDEKIPLTIGEAIEVQDAVLAYTIGSAVQQKWDKDLGSLEVGKKADLIILDKNIFTIDKFSIHEAQVIYTMIDGISVYQAPKKPELYTLY